MNQIRLPHLLLGVMALGAVALPTCAQAQWWSSREPVDYEDCAERAGKTADAKQRNQEIAACESKFAGRRKPGGGYTYYDFMQDRHFDIAGPNPTPQEQREIDQHYTAYLDQNRRNIIAAAFARKQRELTEAKLTGDAPLAAKPSAKAAIKPAVKPPAKIRPDETSSVTPPAGDKPATPRRVVVASLTPPAAAPATVRTAAPPTPRPGAAVPAATSEKPSAKTKRGACREQTFSCGLSRIGDSVSNLTKSIFSPPPKPKPSRG